jgi:hypothetical protein
LYEIFWKRERESCFSSMLGFPWGTKKKENFYFFGSSKKCQLRLFH